MYKTAFARVNEYCETFESIKNQKL